MASEDSPALLDEAQCGRVIVFLFVWFQNTSRLGLVLVHSA